MTTWTIDPTHSEIQFKVKHLVISTVTGSFGKYAATLESGKEDFSDAKISFTADVDSITTGMEQRDQHLKSNDFFNAEQFPKISFRSTAIEKSGEGTYKLKGDLTMRDVTKPVTLDVEFGGIMTDFYGNTKAGFELSGKVNRQNFGLTWSAVTEAGGVVVSDDVRLVMNVQMTKAAQ